MSSLHDVLNEHLNASIITNLLTFYGATHIVNLGEQIRCTCPIHGNINSNPTAFVWNLENNMWYCHTQCQTGGDLLRLHALKNDLREKEDFDVILTQVCSMLGINKSNINFDKALLEQRKELLEWINFTNKTSCDTINSIFDLNLLGTKQNLSSYRMLNKDTIKENNIFYAKEQNRIAFTIYDENDNIVGASLRKVDNNEKIKWLHRPKGLDTGSILYNLNKVIKKDFTSVYIVEGMIDVLNLKQLGIENVVATFGTHVTKEQIILLMKHFTKIILFFDNDTAGALCTLKVIENLKDKFDLFVKYFGEKQIKDAGEIKTKEEFDDLQEMYYQDYIKIVKDER